MDSYVYFFTVFFALARLATCVPAATSMNPQPIQGNGLSSGMDNPAPNTGTSKGVPATDMGMNQLMYRTGPVHQGVAPSTSQQSAPNYQVGNYAPSNNYPNTNSIAQSPFFGLSSNGDFQFSAYVSQIFWILTGAVVASAATIYTVRTFFPSESRGGIVKKIKDSEAARSIDLDRLTTIVTSALDSWSKVDKVRTASRPSSKAR